MSDRHPKWRRVEPGTVIPAGQPYRWEDDPPRLTRAAECVNDIEVITDGTASRWFVDSSWVPPLVLPTEACVIRAKLKLGDPRILFGHPNPGEDGMTFCRAIDGLSYKADEIESFEVLWVDDAPRFPSQEDAFR